MRHRSHLVLVLLLVTSLGSTACQDTAPDLSGGVTDTSVVADSGRGRDVPGEDGADDDGSDVARDGAGDSSADIGDGGADGSTDTANDAGEDTLTDAADSAPDQGGDTGETALPCGTVVFAYDPGGSTISTAVVAGSFNDWKPTAGEGGWPMVAEDDGVWRTTREVGAGHHEYKLVIDDEWINDPTNTNRVTNEFGEQNDALDIDCTVAELTVVSYSSSDEGTVSAAVREEGGTLSGLAVTLNHGSVSSDDIAISGDTATISIDGLPDGIHDLRVEVEGMDQPLLLKFHVGVSTDWRDAVLYFAMTDRFRNGNNANDSPLADVDTRTNWQGGDFAGLTATIDEGYFDDLGVNAIWISWPIANYAGYHEGGRFSEHNCDKSPKDLATVSNRYTAFHGYWPADLDSVDPHFGTLGELHDFVDTAHAHGIRVLLDFTANHVHTSSAFFTDNRDSFYNWPNNGGDHVCENVGWDSEPETCWFTDYLADFNYTHGGARDAVADHAIEWIIESGADGFRVDAVKHVNREFLRTLRRRLTSEVERTGIPFYLVGETFTGDAGLIASFISGDMIHGQFDFPLNAALLDAFAVEGRGLNTLDSDARSIKATYGDGIMSNFIGNHDIARFVSLANGDIYCGPWSVQHNISQGWNQPPSAPSEATAYAKLRLAFTYAMTVPGVPLIYYGDEFGMPGAGDPDNRRMMRFDGELSGNEATTLAFMQTLGQVRADHPALRTGSWGAALLAEADFLAFPRVHADETVIVVINRAGSSRSAELGVGGLGLSGTFTDALGNASDATVSGGDLSVTIPARAAAIFVPSSE